MLSDGYVPPAPQPAVEQRVRAALKRHDPMLDIVWQPAWIFNPAQRQLEGRYVLVSWWPEHDRRHRSEDDLGPARYDIIGAFCRDPLDPSSTPEDPEAVLELLFELLGSMDNEREPALARMHRAKELNDKQHEWVRAEVRDEVDESAERAAHGVFGKRVF